MKHIIVAFVILFTGLNANGQSAVGKDTLCTIFKNLTYKNGRDTIIVKAVLYDVHMAPPRLITKKNPTIYKYKFGSEVAFKLTNCFKEYSEPLLNKARDEKILNGSNTGITLYLTCVVFNEHFYYRNGDPDCIVIAVSRTEPTKLAK